MKKVLIFLFFGLLLNSCKDKCEQACPPNAKCVDGECICSSNFHTLNGSCFEKKEDRFFFKGEGKYCIPPTFIFDIIKDQNPNAPDEAIMTLIFPSGNTFGSGGGTQNGKYYKQSNGDSILARVFPWPTICDINGLDATSEVSGKFNKDKTQLDLKVRFYELKDYNKTLDVINLKLIK